MNILYADNRIVVCQKPFGVLSTDVPGGVPELVKAEFPDAQSNMRTVHRLDRVVGGLMVLARSKEAARRLSASMERHEFHKEYLAVVHGTLPEEGTFRDYLIRNPLERKTYVTDTISKEAQEAVLHYKLLGTKDGLSLVRIRLETGRTHQIRAQFSSRSHPIVGDKKYGADPLRENEIALWSCSLNFPHPQTEEVVSFSALPPDTMPWNLFENSYRSTTSQPPTK